MKKIILGMAMLVAFSLSAFATSEPINGKVIKEFKKTYPAATHVNWYEGKDYYQVTFTQYDMRSTIYFNNEDHIFRSLRYYKEDQLPPFIAENIKAKYKNKKIKSIVEISEMGMGLFYQIVVEDSRNLFIVQSDQYGNLHTEKKLKNTE